ncbi:hypothetical protein RW1_097_00100 [Rhodococcus wratislaviensis NBRC 100605]|uniref:Uncharacterized protein n=1 Tax=Rhodococcus wratislaviensis NBRC 100605 TaxID=1219028 RepID=X0Q4F1_RHOWR|nr:hypothetical protein RW1_097_00100 [Rhodococcus wratislaviensis NBRC 100605]
MPTAVSGAEVTELVRIDAAVEFAVDEGRHVSFGHDDCAIEERRAGDTAGRRDTIDTVCGARSRRYSRSQSGGVTRRPRGIVASTTAGSGNQP